MEGRQLIVNLLEKIHVDRPIALGLHLRPGAARSQIEGLVGPNVEEGRGKLLGDLGKPILDQRQRAGLAGRQHLAVRSFGHILVKVVLQHLMQMPEGLLLRHHRDVNLAGITNQFLRFAGSESAARRRGHRLVGIEERVLKVRRIDVDLEGCKDAHLMLHEIQRGKRPAGEVVVDAAVFHRRPVAHRAGGQHRPGAGRRQQLLHGLHAVEDSRAGCRDDKSFVGLNRQHIAFSLHRRIEGQAALCQQGFALRRACAQQNDAKAASFGLGAGRLLDRLFQVAGGKLVLGIVARHADCHRLRQGCLPGKMRLAGSGKQRDLACGESGKRKEHGSHAAYRSARQALDGIISDRGVRHFFITVSS